jgi:hypothetical protein
MNKKLIAMAIAGALSAPLAANAANVTGFAAVDLMLSTDNPTCENGSGMQTCETQFGVGQAEVDFESNGVRVDVNDNGGGLEIEQANFTTALGSTGWNLTGGKFNSGLSADHQDRNMMAFDTNSLVYNNYSNFDLVNVAGVAFTGMAGPANVTVALVNDPTIVLTTDDAANAFVVAVSGNVMNGVDAGLSAVSADADTLIDLTVDYSAGAFSAGLDYFTAGDLNIDTYSITLGYDLGSGMNVKARVDNTDEDGFTRDTTTIAFDYELASNVGLRLENFDYADDTTGGTADYSQTTLSFIANF